MLSLEASYEAIKNGVVAQLSARDGVRVTGPDAHSFLQGQCTQDISALAVGESTESLLLSPQGKFEAYVRITLLAPEELLLDSESGSGEIVFERLRRFKLRVKLALEQEQFSCLEVRGPQAVLSPELSARALLGAPVAWPGLSGFDLLGLSDAPAGIELGDPGAFEAARIEAGWPFPGRELNEKTIPQEAGITERTVSFTKGCYTGQELVARLDPRGNNVPRHLRGLRFAPGATASPGEEIELEGRPIGQLTSAAYSPGAQALVGLCYLRRDVQVPLEVGLANGSAEALELPIA